MFELLFKYPLSKYQQAEWFLASGWSLTALLIVLALTLVAVAISIALRNLAFSRKLIVGTLQVISCAILVVMLWQPSLRTKAVLPGDNSVAVLLDTSRSMHYSESGRTRLQQTTTALDNARLLDILSTEFTVKLHSVSEQLSELDLTSLPAPGSSSRLKSALTEALDSTTQSVLSGVVLLTDGADTSKVDTEWWQRMIGSGVPIFPVGVGRESLPEDISLHSISLRDAVTPETRINARITVRHGRAGSTRLRITNGEALIYADDIKLPEGVTESTHSVVFQSGVEGIHDLHFQLAPQEGEVNLANNSQHRILTVKDEKKRILYIEGEPRWEYKFIRRALSESSEIEIVSLLQTSPNKFYRQGVANASELEDGFPLDEKLLFSYDAIIVGSFEAAKLNDQQQQHIRDFVRIRGGALLMIAGPRGLSEGGWARTAVSQALPVALIDSNIYSRQRVQARLTALGEETDWLKFAVNGRDNQRLWNELPDLADVQDPGTLKAGASALLEANVNDARIPLLVTQRYGRGKSFVLATSGTWRWQMGLPSQDQRHEQFWQGLLGELVAGSLSQLSVSTDRSVYYDESIVTVTIDARDQNYQPDVAASLSVELSGAAAMQADSATPERSIEVVPSTTPGRYQATVAVPAAGEFSILVANTDAAERTQQERWFLREDDRIEDFALTQDKVFLTKLASETGGRYLDLSELDKLPELLRRSKAVLVKEEVLPLWNVPAAFLLLFLCKLLEWMLRLRWNRI